MKLDAKTRTAWFGKWLVRYAPDDGGRICELAYDGTQLLTPAPSGFRPPRHDHGRYESRPVYGYDDCWPTVDACRYPGTDWRIPDHGELCWERWQVTPGKDRLTFNTASIYLPATFRRTMIFRDNLLIWQFHVASAARRSLPFMHVMHPLMPLKHVTEITLPQFESVYDERRRRRSGWSTPRKLVQHLLSRRPGDCEMLILRRIRAGRFAVSLESGLLLEVVFLRGNFDALGVWWNNLGYPDETGQRRCECAFEPMQGGASSLTGALRQGGAWRLAPGAQMQWQIEWRISCNSRTDRPSPKKLRTRK
ncbi:MAG: hypothetical protein ABR497_09455 [Kiritimatiellia bacterium]|nr:hypothetical protein [Lentisphaerota bacterium]